jgi:hypothetical protein
LPRHPAPQIIAAAAQVMDSTIGHLDSRYGSAHNYVKQELGLREAELAAIAANLMQPGLALGPAVGAPASCEVAAS